MHAMAKLHTQQRLLRFNIHEQLCTPAYSFINTEYGHFDSILTLVQKEDNSLRVHVRSTIQSLARVLPEGLVVGMTNSFVLKFATLISIETRNKTRLISRVIQRIRPTQNAIPGIPTNNS
mmetsp:Transcript_6544/g.12963  ORF Transcript_6544/g.12963 Transcript_6544/m.12963 type:complete len:120 (+) Transcript_6544:87-446(+)